MPWPAGPGRSDNPLGDLLGGLLGKGGGAQSGSGGLGGLLGQGGLADLSRRAEEMLGASKGSVQSTLQDKNQLAMAVSRRLPAPCSAGAAAWAVQSAADCWRCLAPRFLGSEEQGHRVGATCGAGERGAARSASTANPG